MRNNQVRLELKQRLNKLASNDYTNLECWQEAELLNKAQIQWVRKQLHGTNIYNEGDEGSKRRIDDLNILLEEKDMKGSNKGEYFETVVLPENYLEYKKVTIKATQEGCDKLKKIRCVLVPEADTDWLLGDHLRQPSFKWGETFCSLFGNKLRIWTNSDFTVKSCSLSYYRFPVKIGFADCRDFESNLMEEKEIEFKDDITHLIIDEAVMIASGDVGDFNNYTRSKTNVEEGN